MSGIGTKRNKAPVSFDSGVTHQAEKVAGGLRIDQTKRMQELETENSRLKKAVADLTIDKIILKEVAAGKF